MIDIGINFTDKAFRKDLESSIEQAVEAGVTHMIVTGTDQASTEAAIELAHQYPDQLYCTAGVHPHHAKDWTSDTSSWLRETTRDSKVVAVGETGLDFNRDFSPRPAQEAAFEAQLEEAAAQDLPLFLHERDAFERQHAIIKQYRDHIRNAVIHCFTGDKEALYAYLDLDLFIGITGWVCDERRGLELQRLVKDIPDNRLMIETDGPYLLPRDLKPKPKSRRNEPKYLPHIAETIARLRGQTVDELSRQTALNSRHFFGLPE